MTESDKQKEAQFNHISNEVIGQTAWGKFYGLITLCVLSFGILKYKNKL